MKIGPVIWASDLFDPKPRKRVKPVKRKKPSKSKAVKRRRVGKRAVKPRVKR